MFHIRRYIIAYLKNLLFLLKIKSYFTVVSMEIPIPILQIVSSEPMGFFYQMISSHTLGRGPNESLIKQGTCPQHISALPVQPFDYFHYHRNYKKKMSIISTLPAVHIPSFIKLELSLDIIQISVDRQTDSKPMVPSGVNNYPGDMNNRCTNCLRRYIKQTILQILINYVLFNY